MVGKVGKMHRCDNSRERTKDVYMYMYILSTYIFALLPIRFLFLTSEHFKAWTNSFLASLAPKLPKKRKMDGI